MIKCDKRIINLLDEDEKVIFETKADIAMSLPISDKKEEELDKTKVYISNLANLYFFNIDKDTIYYFKQCKQMKRLDYQENNDEIVCKINKLMVTSEKKSTIAGMVYAFGELHIKRQDFEMLNKDINVSFFQINDEESIKQGNELLLGSKLIKIYGNNRSEVRALDNVTIKVNEKDFLCIMGPSGSGKSTLINILSTIDAPTKGKVMFNGKDLLAMSEHEISKFRYENLGFIFQDFNLVDNLTIKENIAVPLILSSMNVDEIEKRIKEIAQKLDIEKILNKYPGQCSGGQKQRAACARALVTKPKIIVADEPTGSLDTKNSHELLKMFQKLNEVDGITIVMVTHDNMIASYSKKLIFIRDGKVDKVLERSGLTQKEYFYGIVDITSQESQNLIDIL